MAYEIFKNPKLVAGKRVADLGAGLGVAGLAAALCGASEVVFLDREPLSLQCALLNAKLNGLIVGTSETVPAIGKYSKKTCTDIYLSCCFLYSKNNNKL